MYGPREQQLYWSHLDLPKIRRRQQQDAGSVLPNQTPAQPNQTPAPATLQPPVQAQQIECAFKYTVQPGDSIYLIAQRFNINIDALIAANPQVTNPDLIFPGMVLCIPEQGVGGIEPEQCNGFIYTVMSGDTLYLISQRFGVPLQALIDANPQITNPSRIFPGQRICIPRI